MEAPILEHVLVQLRNALERDDLVGAANIVEALRPADQADLFNELDEDQQRALLAKIAPEDSADILEELDDEAVAELISSLSDEALVSIMDEMEPDEAADLLGDMAPERARELISRLEDPDEVRPLLLHSDETAGGLMTTEYLALRRRMTAAEAIEAIRRWQPSEETIYYLFVVDQHGRLSGVMNLRQLIVADPRTRMMDIMDPKVISVQADIDQEEAARIMKRYDLLALPVVDANNTLLGVITFDDVIDVLEEEASEDMQRMGGAEPLERAYLDTSPLIITRKRIGWLLVLFVTATLTGSVMRLFQYEMQAVVSLAIFIPLLIGTGGNAGSQTTATIIRSLATGDIEPNDVFRVWWHEARVGILLGMGMAAAAYIRAITWEPNPALALTVSTAIMTLVLWATGVGSVLPLVAAKMGIDPALVSGPLMSTLVDATGLFIYFSIARLILGL
ncbi:MAG: magnesium transporter [Chloroflexi bacterium]|nr:magnesium transporter [Chloroflexota bacterium]